MQMICSGKGQQKTMRLYHTGEKEIRVPDIHIGRKNALPGQRETQVSCQRMGVKIGDCGCDGSVVSADFLILQPVAEVLIKQGGS